MADIGRKHHLPPCPVSGWSTLVQQTLLPVCRRGMLQSGLIPNIDKDGYGIHSYSDVNKQRTLLEFKLILDSFNSITYFNY